MYKCSYYEDRSIELYQKWLLALTEREALTPKKVSYQDILAVRIEPGRHLVEFYIEVPYRPGRLARALQIMAEHGVTIANICGQSTREKGMDFILADFSESTSTPEEVAKALREDQLLQALKVEYFEPEHRGIFYEALGFPLTIDNGKIPIMVVSRMMLLGMLRTVRETFGTGGDVIVYKQAFEGAARIARYFRERLAGLSSKDLFRWHLNVLFSVGWGIFEVEEADGVLVIRARDLFESSEPPPYPRMGCIFTRGYLAGMVSTYFEKQVEVSEVKCRAVGDDYCEFRVKL
ncbi:MAG: hypothetical protein J7L98_03060 [Candidatus Verstraetearchaeota archaeon]|nr:hypothetical protein [Candidatus Verstraetearchaeota archaeon]